MAKQKKPNQLVWTIRFELSSPEASMVRYCRENEMVNAHELARRALDAFYLPLGRQKDGANADEVQRLALSAIQELYLQALYLQRTCIFDREILAFAPAMPSINSEAGLNPPQPIENSAIPQVNSSDKKATSFDNTDMTSFFGLEKVSIASDACPFL